MKMIVFLVCFLSSLLGIIDGGAVTSSGHTDWSSNDVSPSSQPLPDSDQIQILDLKTQISKLQQSVIDITRSFSTLTLLANNPSIMAKLSGPFDGDVSGDNTRLRRDVDAPISSELPTSAPNIAEQPNWNRMMGPYSWPMFSGQCFLCPAGVPGPRGPPGSAGVAGRDGRDGRDAQIGAQAVEVEAGPVPTQPPARIIPVNSSSSSGGAIYVRWGLSDCPESAELVYSGTAGGSQHSHSGSGSNYLCLPHNPIYDEVDGPNADRALLYSSEYQTSGAPPRLRGVHDQTPTCAVCRAPPGRTTKLMVPARNH